jgi:hypothetical protein
MKYEVIKTAQTPAGIRNGWSHLEHYICTEYYSITTYDHSFSGSSYEKSFMLYSDVRGSEKTITEDNERKFNNAVKKLRRKSIMI